MSWCPWKIQKITWARWFFPWFSPWFSPLQISTQSAWNQVQHHARAGGWQNGPGASCWGPQWSSGHPMWLDPREVATWMAVSCATSGIHLVYILYHLIYQLISTYIILYQLIWGWVNTYRYIFSGWTSINPSYDLGFTRYQGFDPYLYPHCGWWLVVGCREIPFGPGCSWMQLVIPPQCPAPCASSTTPKNMWHDPNVLLENRWNYPLVI